MRSGRAAPAFSPKEHPLSPAALLLAACLSADTTAPPAVTEQVHDLATLSAAVALALDGRRELFRVRIDSGSGWMPGYLIFDCVCPDDVHRTVWLVGRPEVEDDMTVAATLRRLCRRGARAPDRRVEEARRLRGGHRHLPRDGGLLRLSGTTRRRGEDRPR